MISVEQLFSYLEEKLPNFDKASKKGMKLFTCPNVANHKFKSSSPTATFITGSDKIACLTCGFRGTIYDVIRLVEKKAMTDEEAISFLTNELKVDAYPELEVYAQRKWSLVPIAKNGKAPVEKEWTDKTHTEKAEWVNWLDQGLNLGLRTGEISRITVIDVDFQKAENEVANELIADLVGAKTVMQNSPHGKHYIFQYDADLRQTVDIGGLKIDIRNDGGQVLVAPSKINNASYAWVNLEDEIVAVPENVKAKLLELMKQEPKQKSEMTPEMTQAAEQVKAIGEGGRNGLLTSIAGLLINHLNGSQTELVLNIINNKFCIPALPGFEIKAMLGSVTGYKETEEQTQEKAIYECCTLLQVDISARDIMEHVFPDDKKKKAIVNKYLAQFHKDGKLVRKGRGKYDLKEKVEWTDEVQEVAPECEYKIPYFEDLAYFHSGDIVLIGGKTGEGKTHIAMNFIKQFKAQGIKPFYISLESGSRHEKVATQLGISQKDYYVSKESIDNPLQMEIEANSVTIVDWLYTGEDFAATQSIFKHLSDEMKRKGGILIVFTQLKENYDWFAVNLIKSFARFAARFIYDDTEGIASHFDVCKITDPKGHYSTAIVSTEFNFETKELKKKLNL
jgi:hypothetical protein